MTILLSDPRVSAVPVRESGDPLIALEARFGPARAMVRAGVADRLAVAANLLPDGVHLRVLEGLRSLEDQRAITARYTAEVRAASGAELDLGTAVDATPEESDGACYFAATGLDPVARDQRELLAGVLTPAGLVNYPTEWWHWSYGDRYWALASGADTAPYGPVSSRGRAA